MDLKGRALEAAKQERQRRRELEQDILPIAIQRVFGADSDDYTLVDLPEIGRTVATFDEMPGVFFAATQEQTLAARFPLTAYYINKLTGLYISWYVDSLARLGEMLLKRAETEDDNE